MCTERQLQNALHETQAGLRNIFGSALSDVLLYGSYARGDQDEESDVDIMALVDMREQELAGYRRRVSDFTSDLDLAHGVVLSITLQDTQNFRRYAKTLPFFQNVMREGISLVQ